jgi:hypothetical protein
MPGKQVRREHQGQGDPTGPRGRGGLPGSVGGDQDSLKPPGDEPGGTAQVDPATKKAAGA